jgi:L-lactate utilization protein LutC
MSDATERKRNKDARRAMLAAIGARLAESAPFDATHKAHHAPRESERGEDEKRKQERARCEADSSTLAKDFCRALESVGGRCAVVRDAREAANVIRELIKRTNARRVAVSDSTLVRSVVGLIESDAKSSQENGAKAAKDSVVKSSENIGAEFVENAPSSALFNCDIGVTSAQWAVAETGTLVLESDAERHRLASLVPPVHVALIESNQVRRSLGEVLAALRERGRDGLSRAVTFITGQSRTSDIELTLAVGVHGPGELHVIIIESVARVEKIKTTMD